MRIRSIKPDFWKSDDTASLNDWNDRLVFIGLWSYVDDNGVGRDNEKLITSELFGLEDDPREASARVRRALERLATRGMITRYGDLEGRRYLHVTNWHHQKIDRPSAPRYPLPTSENVTLDEGSPNTQRGIDADSLRARGGSGIREQGAEDQGSVSSAPAAPSPDRFPEFWSHYPRKVNRADAVKAFTKAAKRFGVDVIIEGVIRLANDPNLPADPTKIPHAATWIHGERWNNPPYEPEMPRYANGRASPPTGYQPSTSEIRAGQALSLADKYRREEESEARAIEA